MSSLHWWVAPSSPTVSSADLYVEVGVTDRVADLLVCAACREHCKGACEGNASGGGDTCRDRDHITLCDTAVEVTCGKFLLEYAGLGCRREVSVKNDEVIFFTELGKRVAVGLSCCYLISHFTTT